MPSENPARLIRTGWASALARAANAALLFELITGLAITFGPFHPAIEWGLLLHTAVGLAALVPLAWYFARHWCDYSGQAMSDVLLLGYIGTVSLAICAGTGLAVTAQGLLWTRTTPLLRYIHLGSALMALAASIPHIFISWRRRRGAEFTRPAAGWLMRVIMACAAGAGLAAVLTFAYSGTKYRNQFPPEYNLLYGKNRPFAPSLARTSTNGAFDARSLAGSATCGSSGCHTQIYAEWKPSAHRYAAMDPIFQGIQNVMAKQNGPESTRYCGGCHDPISLFSGTKNIFVEKLTGLEGYNEGISCVACHSIQKTDIQGNANYTISQLGDYLWQWSPDRSAGAIARNFLIRVLPAQHNRLSKRVYKKPEYCAACHKQFIDQEVNRVGWVQLQNQYDNWAASHWNRKGDARVTVECRECHMPLVDSTDPAAGDSTDYNRSAGDHKHRSHRFLAANNFVPALLRLEGAQKHVELTERWLHGEIDIPEIRSKWAAGPIVKLRIEAPAAVAPGRKLGVRVVLASNKVGHDFPTGPLDMIQSWVELRVADDRGRSIFSSGLRDNRNFLEPGTFLFKAEPVDQYGNLIDRHNLWEMVGVRYRRSLFPGYSDTVEYSVPSPSAPGTLRISATLHYRKIDQFLLNYVMGEKSGLTSPSVDIASATAQVAVTGGGR
ncbi:MAG: cytochrome c family protein [Acidobacteria bacterium]|nr:cytochrome c family protein [Acidobacteriota bacterium]